MKPVLDLPILIPLIVLLLGLGIYASWSSSHHASAGVRKLLLALRSLALLALCLILLNPGKWVETIQTQPRLYPILIDDSASMKVGDLQSKMTRSEKAQGLVKIIDKVAEENGITTEHYAFAEDSRQIKDLTELKVGGNGSNLHHSGTNLFTKLQSGGDSPEALFILTDGRQTLTPKNSTLTLLSRANNAPIYALSIGKNVRKFDLSLKSSRNTITAFPAQNIQITAVIQNQNLGNQSAKLTLTDSEGKELARQELELKDNDKKLHTFSVKAPEKSTTFHLKITKAEREQITTNNEDEINIRILKTKTRVFIAEAAPYWDSKFLAQLLRQQGHMNVHSVHRLSDTRWFRIDSDESSPVASSDAIFPDTKEALSRYDLIIFGKNAEHFLTEQRIEALKSFVRDQGGAILFARGKPYSGRIEALETLEPVNWASGNTSEFNISPTADGQNAGLFGQALPEPNSPIWKSLPSLKDAHRVDSVKPFTRILAEGSLPSNNGKFPLLMVRRYGQGVTGLVNADGLWKWDFYPEAREMGNMYQEFWTQMIQWMVAYSEFLPGHDYSLHTSIQSVDVQEPVSFSISYRGAKSSPKPTVTITSEGKEPIQLNPASSVPVAGKPTWKCSFEPTEPGRYTVTLNTDDDSPAPALTVQVKAPPTEQDNLNPDPVFLAELCESTGGKVIPQAELTSFLNEIFSTQSHHEAKSESVWKPNWLTWFTPIIILSILAAEWWIRRRSGLI